MHKKFRLNKMSRDNDPSNMQLDGMQIHLKPITAEEKLGFYKAKLVEESYEVQNSSSVDELCEELADCLEVIDGVIKAFNLDYNEIMTIKEQKRAKRGGFEKGIIIDYVTIDCKHPRIDRFDSQPHKYPLIEEAIAD